MHVSVCELHIFQKARYNDKNYRLGVFKNMVLRGIFWPKWEKVKESGPKHIMRILMICTAHPVVFRWSS